MKKILKTVLILFSVIFIISGIVFLKFKIWRAEHPNAETWTFYIPNHNN